MHDLVAEIDYKNLFALMKHIGLLCPPTLGHLNPMGNLGAELQRRGYHVTLFGLPDVEGKIAEFQLEFHEIGSQEFPPGSLDDLIAQISELSGMQALKFTISWSLEATRMMFRQAPGAIQEAGVDLLLVDQVTVAGGTIADYLHLPYVTICNVLPLDPEPDIPPYFTSWGYKHAVWERLRNQLGYALFSHLIRPIWQLIVCQRQDWKLPPYQQLTDINSPLAQICQLAQILDFPRKKLSQNFCYASAFKDFSLRATDAFIDETFPFKKLNNKPLIYASLGTLQNRLFNVFYTIAEACQSLDAQLIISLGGGADPDELPALPGSPLVVKFAPQLELLKRSALTITHAGINTVIESLACGVPMVAIPITNDQPGVAARIAYAGVGEIVLLNRLNATNLRAAVSKVFHNKYYRDNASMFASTIQDVRGGRYAADIVEKVMMTCDPVENLTH